MPETKERHNARKAKEHREFRKKNPELVHQRDRKEWLRKAYRVTPEWYDAKFSEQGGACAICRNPEVHVHWRSGRTAMLSVDHDHDTGIARGLLCKRCNRNLYIVEYPEFFANAAEMYLKRYQPS